MTMELLDDEVLQEPAAEAIQGGGAAVPAAPVGFTFIGYTYTEGGHAYPSYVED
ncbi:MAG TPA: hypothetical protein VFR37_12510 [Longimicrobium sp.]|nr:hypothetical protein [Longimicrobium sp.]